MRRVPTIDGSPMALGEVLRHHDEDNAGRSDRHGPREGVCDADSVAWQACDALLRGVRTLTLAAMPDVMFGELLALLRDQLGADDVVLLFTPDDGPLEVAYATAARFTGEAGAGSALLALVDDAGTIATGEPAQSEDDLVSLDGVGAVLYGPLRRHGIPGLLIATSIERGHFNAFHVEQMHRMLALVELALVQADAWQALAGRQALLVPQERLQKMVEERTVELSQARQRAENANAARGRLVASLSHELRSPLHAVIAFADLARRRDNLSMDEARRYFHRIHASGETMLNLVDEMLDLAKIESGRMVFSFKTIDAAQLVRGVADEFESLAQYKQLEIVVATQPAQGRLDAARIQQVLRNLVINAIRHAPQGSALAITLTADERQLRFAVQDRGKGVADADKEAVFEPFVQTSGDTLVPGGTGLGLAICREIVGAHDGRIWVEDVEQGGARFIFTIPCQALASGAAGG